jgi:hypothetical protein
VWWLGSKSVVSFPLSVLHCKIHRSLRNSTDNYKSGRGLWVEVVSGRGGGSAVSAEDCVGVYGPAACRAARAGMTAENLAGDISGLLGVIAADTARHKECVDQAQESRDAGPGETEIEDAEAVATEIKMVDSKAAKEDGEKDSNDLVAASMMELGVKPAALVVGHVDGVDGIDGLHVECAPDCLKSSTRSRAPWFQHEDFSAYRSESSSPPWS